VSKRRRKEPDAFEEGLTGSVWVKKQMLRAARFTIGEEGVPVEIGEASYLLQGACPIGGSPVPTRSKETLLNRSNQLARQGAVLRKRASRGL
jgi:hypothetical protein